MRPTGLMALACAAVLTVACNSNGRNDAARTTDNGAVVGTTGEKIDTSVGRSDRSFVDDVTYAGSAEVELGRLAAFPSVLLAAAAGASGMEPRRFLPADAATVERLRNG